MEVPNTAEPTPEKKQNPWMLLVYFAAILVFANLMGMVARSLVGSPSLAGFAKVNQIIHESLDITGHRDDSIVTIWSLFLIGPLGRYRPVPAETVAARMVELAKSDQEGTHIHYF